MRMINIDLTFYSHYLEADIGEAVMNIKHDDTPGGKEAQI